MAADVRAKPVRVQLRRTKGWRTPENTVKVDRTTPFGNPFKANGSRISIVDAHRTWITGQHTGDAWDVARKVERELRGKNLACWCPLDQPCHADVLLEIANASAQPAGESA